MNELHRELDRLAAGVADDATAERMLGRVAPMVGAIRRRRAARRTGMGMAAVGSAAAVALLVPGLLPTERTTPGPAAPSWSLTAGVECGDPLPTLPTAPDVPLTLVVGIVGEPGSYGLIEYAANPTQQDWPLRADDTLTVMVVEDGTVVGLVQQRASLSGDLEPQGMGGAEGGAVTLATCQEGGVDGTLAAGEYDVYAVRSDAQGATLGTGGPLILQVEAGRAGMPGIMTTVAGVTATLADLARQADAEAEAAEAARQAEEQRAAAEAEIAALREDEPAPGTEFPACGTTVVAPDPDAALAVDAPTGLRLPSSDEPVTVLTNVRTASGTHVLGNVAVEAETGLPRGHLVLARDGIVVGSVEPASHDVTLLDLGPQDVGTIATVGRTTVCTTNEPDVVGLPLPPGAYEVYAVLEIALQEVTGADGTAAARSDVVTVVSPAGEVTVTEP